MTIKVGSLVKLSGVFSANWITLRGVGLVLKTNVAGPNYLVRWFSPVPPGFCEQINFYLDNELEPVGDNEN